MKNTPDSFWSDKIKSKHPYKWSLNYADSFPWFGFVGYEIHYAGNLRVRKSSLAKEKTKGSCYSDFKCGRIWET